MHRLLFRRASTRTSNAALSSESGSWHQPDSPERSASIAQPWPSSSTTQDRMCTEMKNKQHGIAGHDTAQHDLIQISTEQPDTAQHDKELPSLARLWLGSQFRDSTSSLDSLSALAWSSHEGDLANVSESAKGYLSSDDCGIWQPKQTYKHQSVTDCNGPEGPGSDKMCSIGVDDVAAMVDELFLNKPDSAHLEPYFHARPSNLPPKDLKEATRQRRAFEEMQRKSRRQEDRKQRQQLAREQLIGDRMALWQQHVIPKWDSMRHKRRLKLLAFDGIPTALRGVVWLLALDNEGHVTPDLYRTLLSRGTCTALHDTSQSQHRKHSARMQTAQSSVADSEIADEAARRRGKGDKDREGENTSAVIDLDLPRTYPALAFFRKGGPEHDKLKNVLEAFASYQPEIGYVQGMAFLVAVLLLNTDEVDAFVALCSLLSRPLLRSFYLLDPTLMGRYFAAVDTLTEEYMPALHRHLKQLDIRCDVYMVDWVLTLFSKALPLDMATRLWDIILLFGDTYVLRCVLAILYVSQEYLLAGSFEDVAHYLTHLPATLDLSRILQAVHTLRISERRLAELLCRL